MQNDDHQDNEKDPIELWKKETLHRNFFMRACAPSPYHWHFDQAYAALKSDLFLPGVSGLLNGIEASLRTTICELEKRDIRGDQGKVMSNSLLHHAFEYGIDVTALQFDNEIEFVEKIQSKNPNDAVKIVHLRNNICHGNFTEFFGWAGNIESLWVHSPPLAACKWRSAQIPRSLGRGRLHFFYTGMPSPA